MSSSENDPGLPKAAVIVTFRKRAAAFAVRWLIRLAVLSVFGGLITLAVTKLYACEMGNRAECRAFDGKSEEFVRIRRMESGYAYWILDASTQHLDVKDLQATRLDIIVDVPAGSPMRIDWRASYDKRCEKHATVHIRSPRDIE